MKRYQTWRRHPITGAALVQTTEATEVELILLALKQGKTVTSAALLLGMSRRHLQRLIKKYATSQPSVQS